MILKDTSRCALKRTTEGGADKFMITWVFAAWLTAIYYDINLLDTDKQAETFRPKFLEYWAYITKQLAILVLQCLVLFLLHILDGIALTLFCLIIVLFQEAYNRNPWTNDD